MKGHCFSLLVATFICCCCSISISVHGQDKPSCQRFCVPVDPRKEITCGTVLSHLPYDVSLGGMGGIDDLNEKHKKFTMCRFALCCTNKNTYDEHVIISEQDGILKEAMGAQEGEFPHQVFLQFERPDKRVGQCGGTIYNKYHIITATHCVRYKNNPDDPNEPEKTYKADRVTVTAGVTDIEKVKPANRYSVSDVIEHPKYINADEIAKGFDMAVLRLSGDGLDFSNPKIRALRIAPGDFVPNYKINGVFSGWGKTERNETIKHLLKASVPVHHPLTCQRIAAHDGKYFFPAEQHICAAGGDSGLTVGEGDSGGGLVCPDENNRPIHCGVASYKSCTGKCANPSIFMRVSNFTDNFIADATRGEGQDESTLHNEVLGPEIDLEPVPEYLLQIYGPNKDHTCKRRVGGDRRYPVGKILRPILRWSAEGRPTYYRSQRIQYDKDCAGILVAPTVALTSQSCLKDNKDEVRIINAKTRMQMVQKNFGFFGGYEEVKSENVTKVLKDTVRKNDLAYILFREPFEISRYPEIGAANWQDGFEDAWPSNAPEMERRYFNPVSKAKCQQAYDFLQVKLSDDQMCALEKYSGSSTCDRSLGSPLMCGENLCGIASFRGCNYNFPNIFVDVTKLSDDIKEFINKYE